MESENIPSAKPSRHEKPEILLATRNKHKTQEIQTMLGEGVIVTDVTLHAHLPEIEETGITFEENSKLKAEGISRHVRGIVLADDSGLEVDALGKEPGIYSARYAGPECTDEANTALVLKKMKGLPDEVRTARFRCVLAVAENGITLAVFDGTVEGVLAHEVRGEGGFGYDPIFMPLINGVCTQTFGELSSEIKHSMSHRSRALAQFRVWWANR
ncbi:MAG: RdgB/HAM1 family non-canonical purine NTP pyrophosphatase [Chthoniobacterales bacterium]|jgi:XTP/dITP diphosphohydrolase|nr:RdgB/HAM1 family non-canonical purine NTP pyrophosphatase [Chthoniobacterales bacterium]